MTRSETCFRKDNLFASPPLEVHEKRRLEIPGALPAGGSHHASDQYHSGVGVGDAKRFPLSVGDYRLVVVDNQGWINDEKSDIGTIDTLKPPERSDFFTSDQAKALAVIKADQAFLELDGGFS